MKKKSSAVILIFSLFLIVSCSSGVKELHNKQEPITPETALSRYINNGDQTFKWELTEKHELGKLTAYDLLLTSQKWREHTWTHQLTILVPEEVEYESALLFITGGRLKDGIPKWSSIDNSTFKSFKAMSEKNKAITAILRQTPNQPLYDDLVEDQLISFTLHNFKVDNDYSWPLLFPMVKSAVKAMEAIQEFSKIELEKEVTRFTVSGASKRGWTTWLTGAIDDRVEAIGPMVIDVLNMPVSLDYQIEAWNEYSIQIEDYTKLEIPQSVNTPAGNAINQMIDPYSYRKSLTMPKIIFIGTNDEYWPVDAVKNYIYDIPGENYIHYVPNAGHGLNGGEQALQALGAFWKKALEKKPYNNLSYKISSDNTSATLSVKSTSDDLINAYIWVSESDDRDFRDEKFVSENISSSHMEETEYKITFPETGYKAFYIDLEFSDSNGGKFTKSTRMFLVDDDEVL